MRNSKPRILLVEQNESDYSFIYSLLNDASGPIFDLDWIHTFDAARVAIAGHQHDACLVGVDLGEHNGLELVREVRGLEVRPPIIVIADSSDESADEAMKAGAVDCISKGQIDRPLLLRAIRHAIERKRVDDVLQMRECEFKALVENSPDIIARFDRHLRHLYVNPAVTQATGLAPEEFIGKTHRELGGPPEVVEQWESILRRVFDHGEEVEMEYPFCGRNVTRYFHSRLVPERGVNGTVNYVLKISRDVTERRRIEEQLKLKDRAMQSSSDALLIADARQDGFPIVHVNPAFERITGFSADEAIGKNWSFLQDTGADHEYVSSELGELQESALRAEEAKIVLQSYRKDGRFFWNELRIAPIYDADSALTHYVVAMTDITDRKNLEIEHARLLADALEQADKDPLTGLLNHRAFQKRLTDESDRAATLGKELAVVIMDLNNFRYLNDAYGHTTGDQVLRRVSEVLRQRCPSPDTLARFGGDEFAFIYRDPHTNNPEEIERLAESIVIDVEYCPPGHDFCVPLTVSSGAAFLHQWHNKLEMLQSADDRLREKKNGTDEQSKLGQELRSRLSKHITGFAMLDAMVTSVDNKDRYTRRHSEDVLTYSLQIAAELGLDQKTQQTLAVASLLHDIGKTGVPDIILRKPGGLTNEEYESVKQHPMMGAAIVSAVPGMDDTLDCIRHHHERWDGDGYPFGLIKEECPLLARVMAVADAMSAMTTDRPYRKALPAGEALNRLQAGSGTQWDPVCVEALVRAQANNFRFAKPEDNSPDHK